MDTTVGALIADARKRRGWTQEQLAATLYVGQACVSGWERDRRAVTVHDLIAIAHALDINPAALIPDTHHTPRRPPKLDLIKLIADLTQVLHHLAGAMPTPHTVTGWTTHTQPCQAIPGHHWHVYLQTHDNSEYRIDGLHFNTRTEADTWATTNLRHPKIEP